VETLAELLRIPYIWRLENGCTVDGISGFCIFLHRLGSLATYDDLSDLFQLPRSTLSRLFNAVLDFIYDKVKTKMLLDDTLLTQEHIKFYAQTVNGEGAPSKRCFGFIDGTLRRIARPGGDSINQRAAYSGYKKAHGLNWQAVSTPDGMIASLSNPFAGER
jgi:hypothetical protein